MYIDIVSNTLHLKQWIFGHTKLLGTHEVQASWFNGLVIVCIIVSVPIGQSLPYFGVKGKKKHINACLNDSKLIKEIDTSKSTKGFAWK